MGESGIHAGDPVASWADGAKRGTGGSTSGRRRCIPRHVLQKVSTATCISCDETFGGPGRLNLPVASVPVVSPAAFAVIAVRGVALAAPMVSMVAPTMTGACMPVRCRMSVHIRRCIDIVVPVVLYEVGPLPAGVVASTMFRPVPDVSRRHAQVDRLLDYGNGRRGDDHRLGIDHRRRGKGADVDASVEARLADAYRDADVCSG